MKKRLFVLVLALLMLLVATPAFAGVPYVDYHPDKIVWKTGTGDDWYTQVGEMRTSVDRSTNTMTVTFVAYEGYKFAETHLAAAGSLDGIPHSKGGPIPGKFAFGDEWKPLVSEVTYVVDVTGIPTDEIHVVAHSVVVRERDGKTETAWGSTCTDDRWAYPGKNWARWYRAWN